MGGMGLIFNPVLVRRLLGPLDLSVPMISTSRTHRSSKRSCWKVRPASGCLPTLSPPTCPSSYTCNP